MQNKYIRNDINTLKAIAIVAVVLFHFFELVLAQHGNNIQDYLTSVWVLTLQDTPSIKALSETTFMLHL